MFFLIIILESSHDCKCWLSFSPGGLRATLSNFGSSGVVSWSLGQSPKCGGFPQRWTLSTQDTSHADLLRYSMLM